MDSNAGYQNLASQLQAIQSQADIYKGGSPLDASRHINNIATTLSRDYGVTQLSDIGATPGVIERFATTLVPSQYKGDPNGGLKPTFYVGSDGVPRWNENAKYKGYSGWVEGEPVQQNLVNYKYYNKKTNQEIPANK
jgi:hypothetical protein